MAFAQGRYIFITGRSRGIGAATARLAARTGYAVAINYISARQRAEATVGHLLSSGVSAIAVEGDVADAASVQRMFETADGALGRLCGLINCAGIPGQFGPNVDFDAKQAERVLKVNVVGTMLCCQAASLRMSTQHGGEGGAIVNISSAAARLGGSGILPYASSKGAIDTFTLGLALELASRGIRVNAVSPGVIDTEMQPPGRVEAIGPQLPMGRAGRAEEVADAILYLLGSSASYVAGAVLDVSGAR